MVLFSCQPLRAEPTLAVEAGLYLKAVQVCSIAIKTTYFNLSHSVSESESVSHQDVYHDLFVCS